MPTVLIVDDDPAQLQLCRLILQSVPCRIVTTQTTDDALRMLATIKPDLLMLDFFMPNMNGLDLLRVIRQDERFKTMLVLGMTAAPDMIEKDDAKLWDALIIKPFEVDKLRSVVRVMLNLTA